MDIVSQRMRNKFSHEGFLYVFDKLSADGKVKFWRCEKKNNGCHGRIHEVRGRTTTVTAHDHEPDPARVEAYYAVGNMKRRAADTEDTTAAVVSSQVLTLTEDSHTSLPSTAALKQRIRRVRRRMRKAPVCPSSLTELEIPTHYTVYCPSPGVNENYLLFDSGPSERRILIFGRPRALQVSYTIQIVVNIVVSYHNFEKLYMYCRYYANVKSGSETELLRSRHSFFINCS